MPSNRSRRDLVLLVIASFVAQLPFLDRGLSFWDEGSILAIADALRHGEHLYADRVTPVAPLTYELMGTLLRIFGPSLWPGRVLQSLVLCGCVALFYAIAAPLTGRRPALAGAIAVFGVKSLGFPLWTIVNYSQLAMLGCLSVLLCAVRFLAVPRTSWLVAAGLGIGLTAVTKQNLGGMIGAVAAAVVALDWLRDPDRRPAELARRALALAAPAAVVVAVTLALFALRGSVGALYERVVLGSLYLAQPYYVPLPDLNFWSLRPAEIAPRVFAYFPSPLFDLVSEGRLDPARWPLFLTIEHAVKLAYYVPLLFFGIGVLSVVRGLRAGEPRAAWGGRLAVLLFAIASYASMLYRADWTHLMNVYPAVLLLATLLLARGSGRAAQRVALGLGSAWTVASVAIFFAVLASQRAPVETPRGRVRGLSGQAAEVEAVLGHQATQPPGTTFLFLRTDPLYYFLADLRIPVPFDLVVPGYLTPEDDAALAGRLGSIDQIFYDPAWIPTMPTPVTEYLPRTAAALANGFRIDRILTANAFVLKPRADALEAVGQDVVDLWLRFAEQPTDENVGEGNPFEPKRDGGYHRASWLMYRVIAAGLSARAPRACLPWVHRPGAGESVSVLPVMNPALWIWAQRKPAAVRVRFEIAANEHSGARVVLYSEERLAVPPALPVLVPLDGFSGRDVELEFCTELVAGPPLGVVVGWAEPRIVRGAGARTALSALSSPSAPRSGWKTTRRGLPSPASPAHGPCAQRTGSVASSGCT
jgi:hypothetical protein